MSSDILFFQVPVCNKDPQWKSGLNLGIYGQVDDRWPQRRCGNPAGFKGYFGMRVEKDDLKRYVRISSIRAPIGGSE